MKIEVLPDDVSIPGPPTLQRETTGMAQTRPCATCPAEVAIDKADFIKQCDECFRDQSTRRNCNQCNLPRILVTDPIWKVTCGGCFKDSEKRACVSCQALKIPAYEPVWRTLCGDCFRNKDLYRKCRACGQKAIKPGTATFLDKCGPCWLQGREKTHEQCPGCKHLDPRKKKKIGMAFCRDCMKARGLIKCQMKPDVSSEQPVGPQTRPQ